MCRLLKTCLMLVVAVSLLTFDCPVRANVLHQSNPLEQPRRPAQFRNLDELNSYLKELRQYYTILGRPRYDHYV
ncbi:hypothetical protein LSAT2_033008, partial [Lamellibrachia satsuma]